MRWPKMPWTMESNCAFDAKCTHLGCNVNWMAEDADFYCPCHSARFARNGEVTAKPATASLGEFVVAPIAEDGTVTILDQRVQEA